MDECNIKTRLLSKELLSISFNCILFMQLTRKEMHIRSCIHHSKIFIQPKIPFYQESSGRYASPKSDPSYMFSSYGALDLSNDEAQHAASHEIGETSPPNQTGPQTFSGSVSRDNSMDKVK